LPEATLNSNPSWFGFPLTIRDESPLDRRSVIEYLENNRIGTRLLFAGNMVRQPAFIGTNHRVASDLKTADKIMNDSFWIGVWPGIKEKERDYIVDQFNLMIRKMTK
jgi:CDP-6-deoxy-D-xylo-4-hexulose-3-dehydrase